MNLQLLFEAEEEGDVEFRRDCSEKREVVDDSQFVLFRSQSSCFGITRRAKVLSIEVQGQQLFLDVEGGTFSYRNVVSCVSRDFAVSHPLCFLPDIETKEVKIVNLVVLLS
jgi:hypothetical protein